MTLLSKQYGLVILSHIILSLRSIHPRTKLDVAYRLSRSGLAVAYGQQVEYQGPTVSTVLYGGAGQDVNIVYTNVVDIELRSPNEFEVRSCSLPSDESSIVYYY